LVSSGHCIVCSSLIYGFWLPLWYLLAIVLSVFLRYTSSDYPFGIFWPLCCLSFFDIRLLITPLVSSGHCVVCLSSIYVFWLPLWYLLAIVLSVFLRYTASDYLFGIFKLFVKLFTILLLTTHILLKLTLLTFWIYWAPIAKRHVVFFKHVEPEVFCLLMLSSLLVYLVSYKWQWTVEWHTIKW
jgi:hypothetical protein